MVSSQTTADLIQMAVCLASTCTPATVTVLTELLLPRLEVQTTTGTIKKKERNSGPASKAKTTKAAASKPSTKKVVEEKQCKEGNQLSPKERCILATEIINSALRSLSEAIKAPVLGTVRRQASSKDLVKSSARKALRRSISLPQSPLQPRSLNRVTSSPDISSRHSRSSSSASVTSSGHRSVAECARIAFACLRTLQASKAPEIDLPPLQLENGMSALIGKLVSLGLDDLAIKELRILKRRLDPGDGQKRGLGAKANVTPSPQTLAELLDFGKAEFTGVKLRLVVTSQLQVLRLMTSCRKPKVIEDGLPVLQTEHSSSPTRLLLLAAKDSRDSKQTDKIIRQVQTLSEILLSLCPSISQADDALALETRLSISPEVSIQLQTLALHNRFLWWGLAGHEGDEAKEILEPYLRCLSTFARRSQVGAVKTYQVAALAMTQISSLLYDCTDSRPPNPKPILASIFRTLSSLAKDANLTLDAVNWTVEWRRVLQPKVDSDAKCRSALARLVSLKLRNNSEDPQDEELVLTLLDELERPFKGESSEIDDLMNEISGVRRSAVALLAHYRGTSDPVSGGKLSDGMREMCESLVFLLPRLSLRYLGNPLDINAPTKDILRYEQRRKFITKSAIHTIDSTLFLVKLFISDGRATWELVDSKLQDCLLLYERIDSGFQDDVQERPSPITYHVRISNLYYTQYLNMRRNLDGAKESDQIRALRRSLDSIRGRPHQERKMAQFSVKLERMAECCKSTRRYDELIKTLLTLREEMVGDGILSLVVEKATSQPLKVAWTQDDRSSALARTLHSLMKVQIKYLKPSAQIQILSEDWTDEEKGVVLEHQLDLFATQPVESGVSSNILQTIVEKLLSIYDQDKYPLRRLRVLVRRLSLDFDEDETAMQILREKLRSSNLAKDGLGTMDEGLWVYSNHFKSLATTMLELEEAVPRIDILKQGLLTWSSILVQCRSVMDLQRQVEDVPELLVHLNAISEYLQMKGLDSFRVSVLRLIADINEICNNSSTPDDLVLSFTYLGTQWLRLGYSGKAGLSFDRAMSYLSRNGVTSYATLQLHLAHSEYLLAIGSFEKVEDHLAAAQAMYTQEKDHMPKSRSTSLLQQRTKMDLLISDAYMIYSSLALERGAAHVALNHAKQCLRLIRRAWANTEGQVRKSPIETESVSKTELEKLTEDISHLSMSTIALPVKSTSDQICAGSSFWALITPLFRSLSHLSTVFAHHGMFQETVYYAEQAYRLVKDVGSDAHLAMASASLGSTWLKAGVLDRGSEYLMEAKQLCSQCEQGRNAVLLTYNLGNMYGLLGESEKEISAYEEAESITKTIGMVDYINSLEKIAASSEMPDVLEQKLATLTLTSKRKTSAPKKAPARPKAASKRKAAARANSPVEVVMSIAEECPQLNSLAATILRQKARALISTKKFGEALVILQGVEHCGLTQLEAVDHGLAMAKQLLFHSLEQMNADPVYSVLQDSTISFPSVVGLTKSLDKHGERLSLAKTSPPRRGQAVRGTRERAGAKSPAPGSFFDKLHQAQEYLTEIQSMAIAVAPMSVVHTTSALLNSVAILLSAAGQVTGKSLAHPGLASSSIENARTLALRRERKVIRGDPTTLKVSDSCWPQLLCLDPRRSGTGTPSDLSKFQKDFVDIIPKSWTVISISLNDSRQELSVTKLQAGHSPFVLRLPLGRHNSMDADEEVFGFEQGHAELHEILGMANESAHDARDRTGKEAKTAWWEEREALDARLKDLLENIEKVWLGGFTGIFSQHARRPELLARFQKSFQNILDRHLPSRRKTGRKAAGPRITLDSRILDLFIGLGDASDEECDFSEPLTDLLYFVVDVLQFHGELNAYAEIDFDSIVIGVQDALRGYHSAVHASGQVNEGRHTILVLDKALHSFPWESLPCMDGLAVSRLPSLGCLRDRILSQQKGAVQGAREGHYISRQNASYILNPGGDLKHTQSVFQKPLQSLNCEGIINREPLENEIKETLQSKDLLLYFGHGSGAQYIRAREIKKLDNCAVAVLMGCSSGALVERGEFEPYGPPINYMHAGCPALVATLWDVTDKDIDRFAKSAFEHWGLFETGRKGKKKQAEAEMEKRLSLVEAVAEGKGACNLRYLNAAAVCVYGVPVYFE
ncbi:hypothetical protein B2J93_2228 [Marssonina coronariae]|uniref:separase n=1 Tax=Diplocarpon coronariae TaxID=2795749 RepID=A0A218YT92_9HELO|nr:hypothetical protein B2J93_2228 [Marssonina coronariae]